MFIDPDTQNEVRIRRHRERLLRQLSRQLGRQATEQELDDFLRKRERDREQRSREKFEAEAQRQVKVQLVLDRRASSRNEQPPDYLPPTSVEALRAAVTANQPYCAGTSIEGTKEQKAVIDFDLRQFNLSGSRFTHVRFSNGADLSHADLSRSHFQSVVFGLGLQSPRQTSSHVLFEILRLRTSVQ